MMIVGRGEGWSGSGREGGDESAVVVMADKIASRVRLFRIVG